MELNSNAMKKYLFSLMALAAIFACTRELPSSDEIASYGNADEQVAPEQGDEQKPQVQMIFTGVSDPDVEKPKTMLDVSDFGIVWSMGETISVLAGSNDSSASTFEVVELESGGRGAVFSGSSEEADVYYAVSPAQSATVSGGVVTATLPTSQTAVENSFGPTANLSIAKAEGTNQLFFRNTGAIVGFTVGYDDVTRVKFEGLGASDVMSGTATFNLNGGVMPALTGKTGVNYVEMTGDFVKNSTYYFVILPGTYANGVKITFYKGTSQRVPYSLSTSLTIKRNDYVYIGKLDSKSWEDNFTPGDKLTVRGSGAAEAGQEAAYVGSTNYWHSGITHAASELADYPYNYEIFTRLTGGSTMYFSSDDGAIFTLNAAGTSVSLVDDSSSAAFSAPETGIYRIRMHLPSGSAEVKQIKAVKVYQNSCARETSTDGYVTMTYYQKGAWFVNNFCLRRGNDGWANRYKFRFTLKDIASGDESVENYGRWSDNGDNPTSYPTGAVGGDADYRNVDYFYVQPADGNDFEPGFKFVSTYEVNENRYYARLGLEMTNKLGHYSHTITWIMENRIVAGDEVFISGNGVDETSNQLKLRYSTAFNNAYTNSNAGDESGLAGAEDYNYEVFCKLKKETKFIFNTANGKHYELNADTTKVIPLYPGWGAISNNGVLKAGVYRIRINFGTGAVSLDRVSEARYLQLDRGTNQQLLYDGNGTWKQDNVPFGWTHPNAWDNSERYKFWFQIYFVDKTTWQYLGRYESDAAGVNLQTVTNPSWQWHNKLSAEWDSSLNTYLTGNYTATVRVKLNADGYTYQFSNIAATE